MLQVFFLCYHGERYVQRRCFYCIGSESGRLLILIEAAKEKIKKFGVISSTKNLQNGLYEKKWKNGLRLYFALIEDNTGKETLLILGSGKGKEQDKAIIKSREILKKYKIVKTNLKII